MTASNQPTGPALDREVEYRVFGDDLSAFDAEGNERRERIAKAVTDAAGMYVVGNPVQILSLTLGGVRYPIARTRNDGVAPLDLWDHREGEPWRLALEDHVNHWKASPRPFSRDVRLAIGLLGDRWNVYREPGCVNVIIGDLAAIGKFRIEGTAFLSEFPSAKDDAERREWAMATAICRAVLNAKGGER